MFLGCFVHVEGITSARQLDQSSQILPACTDKQYLTGNIAKGNTIGQQRNREDGLSADQPTQPPPSPLRVSSEVIRRSTRLHVHQTCVVPWKRDTECRCREIACQRREYINVFLFVCVWVFNYCCYEGLRRIKLYWTSLHINSYPIRWVCPIGFVLSGKHILNHGYWWGLVY